MWTGSSFRETRKFLQIVKLFGCDVTFWGTGVHTEERSNRDLAFLCWNISQIGIRDRLSSIPPILAHLLQPLRSCTLKTLSLLPMLLLPHTGPYSLVKTIEVLENLIIDKTLYPFILFVYESVQWFPTRRFTCKPLRFYFIERVFGPWFFDCLSFYHLIDWSWNSHIVVKRRVTEVHMLLSVHCVVIRCIKIVEFVQNALILRHGTHLIQYKLQFYLCVLSAKIFL